MSTEDRVTTLEKQMESLNTVLHQFVKSLQEMKQNQTDVSGHMASVLRTVFDNRNLTKAGLAESAVLNQIDKLNHYLQSAIKAGILEPSNGPIQKTSLVVAQQFDSQKNEINRRVLLNVSDMTDADKAIFEDRNPGEEVTGFSESPEAVLLIHEVYQPVTNVEKTL